MNAKLEADRAHLEKVESDFDGAKKTVPENFEYLLTLGRAHPKMDQSAFLGHQAKQLAALSTALQEDNGQLPEVASLDASDRVGTIALWPNLLEIVRAKVSSDLADTNGQELMDSMEAQRTQLDDSLKEQLDEMKVRSRNLKVAIEAAVGEQQRKINKLSALGELLRFGNVTGIRIKLAPRKEMLQVLESLAAQGDIFADDRPVERILSEYFDKRVKSGFAASGEALLDYRSYVDLAIEARRDNAWAPAASLSGGESIGAGLAVALILSRSIAAKSDIKVDQISPVFVIDEVQRLDDKGQKVIVDFAKREDFQVLVTAPKLSGNFDCTLYSISRQSEPQDRIVIRGIRRTPGG